MDGMETFLSTICKEAEDSNKKTTNERHPIGTRINKNWDGKPYMGTVISNTGTYYKKKYEDNDEEELSHTEVTKYM
jgi:hypothetical protein